MGLCSSSPSPVATPNLWERMLQPCLALPMFVLGTQPPCLQLGWGMCRSQGKSAEIKHRLLVFVAR